MKKLEFAGVELIGICDCGATMIEQIPLWIDGGGDPRTVVEMRNYTRIALLCRRCGRYTNIEIDGTLKIDVTESRGGMA